MDECTQDGSSMFSWCVLLLSSHPFFSLRRPIQRLLHPRGVNIWGRCHQVRRFFLFSWYKPLGVSSFGSKALSSRKQRLELRLRQENLHVDMRALCAFLIDSSNLVEAKLFHG